MAAAGRFVQELCEEAMCPICLEYFTDPVTVDCGHNFCRACLTQSWGEPDRNSLCPECRQPIQQIILRPNRKLATIAEISKNFKLQVARETEGTGDVCKKHQEPLKLFCRDDEAPICVVCDRSKEHREHQVIPIDEAAAEYKEKMEAYLKPLLAARRMIQCAEELEEQACTEYLEQLQMEKQKIVPIFQKMHKFLKEQERIWLMQQADMENIVQMRLDDVFKLTLEVDHYVHLTNDVKRKCQQPPSEFLQDIRNTLNRCKEVRQCPTLPPGFLWRLRSCCPNSSVLEKAMKLLEGSLKQALGKVSVTLDPFTRNPCLALSQDLKCVKRRNSKRKLPKSPARFDLEFCVLGQERFTSGRHWWEVEVERLSEGRRWAVGVAKECLQRKGRFTIIPNEEICAVGEDPSRVNLYSIVTSPELEPLCLMGQPRKIRVFLDYEEGRVEFFDADTDERLFTFHPAFFGEGIRPFFWVEEGVRLRC